MREFFCSWKRKVGVVSLVMACMFMAGWTRSLITRDHARAWGLVAISNKGEFYLLLDDSDAMFWKSEPIHSVPEASFGTPYSIVVVPMTFISIWLLLTKPRGSTTPLTQPDGTTVL